MIGGVFTEEKKKTFISMTIEDICNVFEEVKPRHWNNKWSSWCDLETDLAVSILKKQEELDSIMKVNETK